MGGTVNIQTQEKCIIMSIEQVQHGFIRVIQNKMKQINKKIAMKQNITRPEMT